MKNKSINIKEEILNSFRENYEQKDGEWGYHGWVEETGFGEVYKFLSNSLDRMEREVREETIKETDANWYMEIKSKAISKSPYGLSPNDIDEIFDKYRIQESEEKPKA